MPRTKKSALTTQDPGRGKEVARVTRQVSGRSIINLSIGDYLQPICQDILTKNAFCIRSSRVARLTTVQHACARHCEKIQSLAKPVSGGAQKMRARRLAASQGRP